MLKKICTISVLGMLLLALPAWAFDFQPGKYEITIKMEMPGMPGAMPPQTQTQCLTAQNPVPDASPESQGCKVANMKTRGNTVTYTIACTQPGMEAVSTAEMTYKGDSFEGTTRTSMGPEAGGMTVITVVKGSRIGNCE